MTQTTGGSGGSGFTERLLALLNETSTATTYKFALLLALINAAIETTDETGEPAAAIPVRTLADHVLSMYWPHSDPYPGLAEGPVLKQSGTGQAEILTEIRKFRQSARAGGDRSTIGSARFDLGYGQLLGLAEWKLAEMPLPRLHKLGNSDDRFIFDINWSEKTTRTLYETTDRLVHLQPGAGSELVRLAPLIRPLVERLWAARVTKYNRLPEGNIDEFLFARARIATGNLRRELLDLQLGRCFYTGLPLKPTEADVDHFVPWSRSPLNAIENLVVAGRRVNGNKSDHLAALEHVARWREHHRTHQSDLSAIALANRWQSAPEPTLGVARSIYLGLHQGVRLWAGPGDFVPVDTAQLPTLFAA